MKHKMLKAIQAYKELDIRAAQMASNMSLNDPLYIAADYAGMLVNIYVYKVINYMENKLQ